MRVNHLKEPKLDPCPGMEDIKCSPTKPKTKLTGYECCNYWKNSPNRWTTDVVRTDLVNPEKFRYDEYRYQLYAKPAGFNCNTHSQGIDCKNLSLHEPGPQYIRPTTDIRALHQTTYIPLIPTKPGGETLHQTTYIPLIPTKPGGERDVTFPMTPRTMGQPDVTTACCVPVMPCQPGFQNLTQHIKPTSQEICSKGNYCTQPNQLQHNPCQNGGSLQCNGTSQYTTPPNNIAGSGCVGLPDTFPQVDMRHSLPCTESSRPNNCEATGSYPCFDDGTAEGHKTGNCMNAAVFRHKDRVNRSLAANQETEEQRYNRLHMPFGHYGSCISKVSMRRYVRPPGRDQILEQGNGFHWDYPKHENNQCYVLQRNSRC